MLRPEGHITIGADGSGTNNFVGYLHSVSISPTSMSDEDIKQMYDQTKQSALPSLVDDDFEETDPNSRFVLSPAMKPVFDKPEPFTLSAATPDFNIDPLGNGGYIYPHAHRPMARLSLKIPSRVAQFNVSFSSVLLRRSVRPDGPCEQQTLLSLRSCLRALRQGEGSQRS